jgi:hypothetical protein
MKVSDFPDGKGGGVSKGEGLVTEVVAILHLWLYFCSIDTVRDIAVEDINSLESEFMALQHSVQK